MSELIKARVEAGSARLGLLTGASTLALLSVFCASQSAVAAQDDRPVVWIELGGQLERVNGTTSPFKPDFLARNAEAAVIEADSPVEAQHLPRYSLGEEGKISFQPAKDSWMFIAAVRYGRSNGSKDFQEQTNGLIGKRFTLPSQGPVSFTEGVHNFSEVQSRQQESHLILDFQAGKDVGLGLLGWASNINVGVRFAQLVSKANVTLHARPDVELYRTHPFPFNPAKYFSQVRFHTYALAAESERSFHGVGPSLSWNSSVPLMAGDRDAHLDLDFGLNGAVLFGRQKTKLSHQTTARHFKPSYYHFLPGQTNQPGGRSSYKTQYVHGAPHTRFRSVMVPNLGAFAGISYRIDSFKMSAGYRADFFFGAMDTGIDVANRATTSFHGPFATISLGFGG